MSVNLIFAQSRNRFIGKNNELLFSIPEDMARFKELTKNSIVIMGRNTWDSLPKKFRPLPGRLNVIITSRSQEVLEGYETLVNVRTYPNLKEAINLFKDDGRDVWLIGGERIYAEGIQYADKIFQTVVSVDSDGDAKAPFIDTDVWKIKELSPLKVHGNLSYQFIDHVRKES